MKRLKKSALLLSPILFAVLLLLNNQEHRGFDIKESKAVLVNKEAADLVLKSTTIIPKPGQTNETEKSRPAPITQQLAAIAQAYKTNSQYPSYSKPLMPTDWNLLNPRAFIPSAIPLPQSPNITASIITSRYIHNRKRELSVDVIIESKDKKGLSINLDQGLISLQQKHRETDSVYLSTIARTENKLTLRGNIPPGYLGMLSAGESTIFAKLHFLNGTTTESTAQIKLFDPKAELLEIGEAYVEGSNLMIPFKMQIQEAGFYRVRANLFDQTGTHPISHLNSAFKLAQGSAEATLQVHATTLRTKQNAGPYILKDFDIIRQPSRPGDQTGYGTSLLPQHSVKGHDLESYDHSPYKDEQIENRIRFLETISSR